MLNRFLKATNRDKTLFGKLYAYLEDFTDEEKCKLIVEAAKSLMAIGSEHDIFSAELILVHATQHYMADCPPDCKARLYYVLGQLHEHYTQSFIKAYTYYEKYALNNTVNEGSHSVLLRALILRDNFTYSEQLEEELKLSLCEYDLGERNDRLYENLGSLIVARHKGDAEREEALIKRLKSIVKGDEFFFLDFVLTKDKRTVRLNVPQKVLDYIEML